MPNILLRNNQREEGLKNMIDENYLIHVKDYMNKTLPRPRLKPVVLVNDGEWLQIIHVETEI